MVERRGEIFAQFIYLKKNLENPFKKRYQNKKHLKQFTYK